ncbi:MAG: hypothetical protein HC889_19225 [Synechococcaceae cyanobacterium SM1_2_3]|nr:hypothetical protein [Synechococcaceae cyanobacterium SM1_2_3]
MTLHQAFDRDQAEVSAVKGDVPVKKRGSSVRQGFTTHPERLMLATVTVLFVLLQRVQMGGDKIATNADKKLILAGIASPFSDFSRVCPF